MSTSPQFLLVLVRDLLRTLPSPCLRSFLAEWPNSPARVTMPSSLPVLEHLSSVAVRAPIFTRAVTAELIGVAASLTWRRSYSAEAAGAEFFENYGWTEIAGLTGPIPSRRLAVGFLMLGPSTHYPSHRHEAQEIYVPLSGAACWCGGDGVWTKKSPGSVIVHERDESHAMRTTADALLALYLWRSETLDQESRLDPPG